MRFCCKERWVSLSKNATFSELDLNSDGVLDASDVKAAMEKWMGEEPPDFLVRAMIDAIDQDHNGTIDLEEFDQLMALVESRGGARS